MRAVSHENPKERSSRSSARRCSAYQPPQLGIESRPGKRVVRHATTSRRHSLTRRSTTPNEGGDLARGSLRPAAASYRRTASEKSAPGSAVRRRDSRSPRKSDVSSRLPGAGLALMMRRAARSVADSSPEKCRLGTLFEAKDVEGSGGRGHGSLQSGIGEVRSGRASIAPTGLSETTRLPRTLCPPLFPATRGASGRPGGPSRTNVAPRFLIALYCGPAHSSSGERRAAVNSERAATVHPEMPRRQERSNVRPCWNQPAAGILKCQSRL